MTIVEKLNKIKEIATDPLRVIVSCCTKKDAALFNITCNDGISVKHNVAMVEVDVFFFPDFSEWKRRIMVDFNTFEIISCKNLQLERK